MIVIARVCKTCGQPKDGYVCNPCRAARYRTWRAENPTNAGDGLLIALREYLAEPNDVYRAPKVGRGKVRIA